MNQEISKLSSDTTEQTIFPMGIDGGASSVHSTMIAGPPVDSRDSLELLHAWRAESRAIVSPFL